MSGQEETVMIPFVRFRDKNGNPTCAINFAEGKVCEHYRTQRFGTHETCVFASASDNSLNKTMDRRDKGDGTLIPGSWCPLWKNEQK